MLDVQREIEDSRAISAPPVPGAAGQPLVSPQNEQYLPPGPQQQQPLLSFEEFGRRSLPDNPRMISTQQYKQIQEGFANYQATEQLSQQRGRDDTSASRVRSAAAVGIGNVESRKGEIEVRQNELDERKRQRAVVEDMRSKFKTLEAAAVNDIITGQGDTDVVLAWKKLKGLLPPDFVEAGDKAMNELRDAAVKEIQDGKPGRAVDAYTLAKSPSAFAQSKKAGAAGKPTSSNIDSERVGEDLFGKERADGAGSGELGLENQPGIVARLSAKEPRDRALGWAELFNYRQTRGGFMTGDEGTAQREAIDALLQKNKPKPEEVLQLGPRAFSDPAIGGTGAWVGMEQSLLTKRQVEDILKFILTEAEQEKMTRDAINSRSRYSEPEKSEPDDVDLFYGAAKTGR
jgi:hypothetical protein